VFQILPSLFVSNAAVIEALASLVTMIVAVLVFLEARSIRKAEGIFRQNQAWNEFGNKVAEVHKGSRIGELLMGRKVVTRDDLTPKEAFLLMSFFNVVSSEYNAYRAKSIDRNYVIHSLAMTARIVKINKEWIFTFLRDYGYEQSFRRIVAIVALTSDEANERKAAIRREQLANSVWGTVCGPRYRAWLRKQLPESEVRALCEGNVEGVEIGLD
jgi:hypothetical protein